MGKTSTPGKWKGFDQFAILVSLDWPPRRADIASNRGSAKISADNDEGSYKKAWIMPGIQPQMVRTMLSKTAQPLRPEERVRSSIGLTLTSLIRTSTATGKDSAWRKQDSELCSREEG
jgi:hypothetical protein